MSSVWWKRIVLSLGVIAIGIGGLLFWRIRHPAPSPMIAMVQSNQRAYQQFEARINRQDPRLLAHHGLIAYQALGLTAAEIQAPGIVHQNQITGSRTLWNQDAAYFNLRRRQLGVTNIPTAVWLAGMHQAAKDLTMLVGNDPMKAVLDAGPDTAPKFWSLEQALYIGKMGVLTHPHWTIRVIAATLPYPHGPLPRIYPVIHQARETPATLILFRVPVILKKIEVVAKAHNSSAVHAVIQTGVAIMGLTHSASHWQWWAEQIVINPAAAST